MALRPVRDLLRRRGSLVHQRTALLLSFKSLYARTTGQSLDLSQAKTMEPKQAPKLYEHPANQLIAQVQTEHIQALGKSISDAEAKKFYTDNPGMFQEPAAVTLCRSFFPPAL